VSALEESEEAKEGQEEKETMTVIKHSETWRCSKCGNKRLHWLSVKEAGEMERMVYDGRNMNCPTCGLPLMEPISGNSIPIDPRQLVVWDEEIFERDTGEAAHA